ncbi:MAG: hypothetical protein D6722_22685 [Bacteroidetes bacterium]|nr:MAG: hypothetical protein D6722_22685 [Bacteroidota bacterium]
MKHLYILLITCLLMPSLRGQVTFILDDNRTQAVTGSEIIVPVRVENFVDIRGFSGTIIYDPTIVEFIGMEDFLLSAAGNALINIPGGYLDRLVFSWYSASGVDLETVADGASIFTLRFKLLGTFGDQSPLSFSNTPLGMDVGGGGSGIPLPVAWQDGRIKMGGLTIKGDTLSAPAGGQVVMPIRVKDYHRITGGQGGIFWDPTKLDFVGTEQYGLPSISAGSFGTTQVASGELGFSYYQATGSDLNDDDILFAIRFDVLASPGEDVPVLIQDGVLLPLLYIEFSQENPPSVDHVYEIVSQGLVQVGAAAPTGVQLAPKVFLQGPYQGGGLMGTNLISLPTFPLTDPYLGTETTNAGVLTASGQEVVDWVLVELRDPGTPATVLYSRPGLLQKDGDIVAADGSTLSFPAASNGNYYVAIKHRNHLGVMTASALALSGTVVGVDFSTALTFGVDAQKDVSGVNVMWAGDADGSGAIQNTDDILYWQQTTGQGGYLPADYDLNGIVQNTDRILFWVQNTGKSAQLP